jgi:hypothetical protein
MMVAPNVALPVMLPVPTIVGISKNETGMLSEERTILSNILSFPYSSMTSRYAVDMSRRLVVLGTPHPVKRARIQVDVKASFKAIGMGLSTCRVFRN